MSSQQEAAFEKVDRTDLNNGQSKAVDQAISAETQKWRIFQFL